MSNDHNQPHLSNDADVYDNDIPVHQLTTDALHRKSSQIEYSLQSHNETNIPNLQQNEAPIILSLLEELYTNDTIEHYHNESRDVDGIYDQIDYQTTDHNSDLDIRKIQPGMKYMILAIIVLTLSVGTVVFLALIVPGKYCLHT